MPSDEIHLYANDMQCSYTEYGTKSRIEPTEATGIYSLCLYLICAEYEFETFGSNTFNGVNDVIDVSHERILSINDEIGIITNDV